MTAHTCHAIGCKAVVPPRMFSCPRHWAMLPAAHQRAVKRTYRLGQEIDKRPSAAYLAAANSARHCLHQAEGIAVSRLCVVCIEDGGATAQVGATPPKGNPPLSAGAGAGHERAS